MFSGLDTESIISELVSAQSVKKNSLVKAQTKLSWKQDAWKALNTKIYSFYTNTLSDMRYQGSYMKKTTKVSNTDAISVLTSDDAVDGVRSVKVDQLAKGARLTSGSLNSKDGVYFGGSANLAQLRKNRGMDVFESDYQSKSVEGSFRVVGAQGQYVDFDVNENTTIDDIVSMIKSTGLNANFDQENQRIFISSKNTGELNNFNLVANDEGGYNALAFLGLLSKNDIVSDGSGKKTWTETWAEDYRTGSGTAGDPYVYTDAYKKLLESEVAGRAEAYKAENDELTEENEEMAKASQEMKDEVDKFLIDLNSSDYMQVEFQKYQGGSGTSLYMTFRKLYEDGGLFDELQKAQEEYNAVEDREDSDSEKQAKKTALEAAQKAYDDKKGMVDDFIQEVCYGPLEKVQAKDADGNLLYETDGTTPIWETEKDEDGNTIMEDDGVTPVYVMERNNAKGLNKQYEDAAAAGTVDATMQANVDSVNKWYNAFTKTAENKETIAANKRRTEENTERIKDNEKYFSVDSTTGKVSGTGDLEAAVKTEFDDRITTAQNALAAANDPSKAGMFTASKVNAQDSKILIDGAEFTSMTNTFSVNGLTLTAQEVTDKEVTMTTSTDTDGIYNMIKNFFSEYNKLINEMDSLYNAEAATGYEPLLSEEKEALSDSEVEEWEKKIKDSLLRRDSTLSSVSFGMASVLLKGTEVNGKMMYLSDFGINTLGYFKAAENERNAYHIDGDPDDAATKANEDVLKSMIASDPDTVMNFFTKLSTNLYDDLTKKMAGTTLSSAMTVYNDKLMKSEYADYTDKIKKQEEKLNAMMDKWYAKFSAMEVAMSKLESRSSSLASILGG